MPPQVMNLLLPISSALAVVLIFFMRERRERSTIDLNDSHSTKRRHVDNVIDVTAYDDSILVTPALNDSYNINTTDMMTSAIVSDGDDDDGEDALFDRVQPQSRLDTTCN